MCPDKKRPAGNTGGLPRGLTLYGRISARQNQKELNEIRRRFKLDKNSISRIYGCYVNSSREIIAYIDESMGLMSQEEQEMYLGLLKKALSGTWAGISSTSNSPPPR